ncbi:MAG: hypothetical protein Q8L48_44125 [Archangium sp.]|nr:hypothetical protein [Archangium sp.]
MFLEALGLSVGELHLTLDEKIYRPGETITGTVRLDLNESSPAKRLVVGLLARQRAVGLAPGQQGLQLSYRNDKVWDFHFDVDGPRLYRPKETARFELLIPLEATDTNFSPPEGLLGDVARALSFLSNVKRFPLEWKVYAFLDRPWQLNPKGEVQLQLRPLDEDARGKQRAAAPPVQRGQEATTPRGAALAPKLTPKPKSKKRSPPKKKPPKTKRKR